MATGMVLSAALFAYTLLSVSSRVLLLENDDLKTAVAGAKRQRSKLFRPIDVPPVQEPCVWEALRGLKGSKSKSDLYPRLATIPATSFRCSNIFHPGFYADEESDCQVVRRCDPDGRLSSYLCPIGTIFNQITLTCDHWYNVNCSRSVEYIYYSNPRLYNPKWPLLDDCNPTDTHVCNLACEMGKRCVTRHGRPQCVSVNKPGACIPRPVTLTSAAVQVKQFDELQQCQDDADCEDEKICCNGGIQGVTFCTIPDCIPADPNETVCLLGF